MLIAVVVNAFWAALFALYVTITSKRTEELSEQANRLAEQTKQLRKIKNENAELKAENRNLKTQLKEQTVGGFKGEKNDQH